MDGNPVSYGSRIYVLAAILVLSVTLVYLPALQNDFVNWDDEQYIIENSHIRSFDIIFLKWAFLKFYAANWHPMTWLSHALDYRLWALNPAGHHLTGIILHSLNTLLVFLLTIKLLEAAPKAETQTMEKSFLSRNKLAGVSAITALLFGIHPLHVESVVWISERKDVLYSFFFLLSLLSYLRYARDYQNLRLDATSFPLCNSKYLAAIGLFSLSLMSKPMAVTLPFVLLILDFYPLQRLETLNQLKYLLKEKIPFFALSLISSVLTLLAQNSSASNVTPLKVVALPARILLAFKALIAYIGKMIWPAELIPLYKHPVRVSVLSLEYLPAIILCAAITTLCIIYAKKQRVFLAVWAYYVISLLPVLGIIQVGRQAMADRYMYLPSIGPFLLAGLLAVYIYNKSTKNNGLELYQKVILYSSILISISMLSYSTIKQSRVWKDSITLWSHEISVDPTFPEPYHRRGNAYRVKGYYHEALDDLTRAISLNPLTVPDYYNERGIVYTKLKNFPMALNDFNTALLLAPENPAYRKNFQTAIMEFEYHKKLKPQKK